jgi:hypothetical protein
VLDCYTRSGYVFIWLEGTVKLELLEGNILEEVEPSKGFFWRKRAGRWSLYLTRALPKRKS